MVNNSNNNKYIPMLKRNWVGSDPEGNEKFPTDSVSQKSTEKKN